MKNTVITGAVVALVAMAGIAQAKPNAPKSGVRVVAGAKALTQIEKASVNGLGGRSHHSDYKSHFDWGRNWGRKGHDNDCDPQPPRCEPPPPPCVPPPCVPPPCVPPSVPPS